MWGRGVGRTYMLAESPAGAFAFPRKVFSFGVTVSWLVIRYKS